MDKSSQEQELELVLPGAGLSHMQAKFVNVMASSDIHPIQAAILAGYSVGCANTYAGKLMHKPRVLEAIERKKEELSRAVQGARELNENLVIGALIRIANKCESLKLFGASIDAYKLLGQRLGLFSDVVQLDLVKVKAYTELERAEAKRLASLAVQDELRLVPAGLGVDGAALTQQDDLVNAVEPGPGRGRATGAASASSSSLLALQGEELYVATHSIDKPSAVYDAVLSALPPCDAVAPSSSVVSSSSSSLSGSTHEPPEGAGDQNRLTPPTPSSFSDQAQPPSVPAPPPATTPPQEEPYDGAGAMISSQGSPRTTHAFRLTQPFPGPIMPHDK